MRVLLLIVGLIGLNGSGITQQTPLRGIVSVHNSLFETGIRKYVTNAQVADDFDKASPVVTDVNGRFELKYIGVPEKQSVSFQVTKPGFEVVNISELKAVAGQAEYVKIYMADPAKIAEYRRKIYKIGKTEAEKNLTALVEKKKKEIKDLKKDLAENQAVQKKLEDELAELTSRFKLIEAQAEDLARRYAYINLDDATPFFRQAFDFFQQGDLEAARKILANLDFEEMTDNIIEDRKKQSVAKQELRTWDSLSRINYENTVNGIRLKLDLHRTSFQFDSISQCYLWLIKLDSTDQQLLLDYALFNIRLRHDSLALGILEKLLLSTREDSLVAVVKTEMGSIYQSRNEFEKAKQLFHESLEIQKRLFSKDSTRYSTSFAKTQARLGHFYLSTNDYAQAELTMKQALHTAMLNNADLHENRANLSAIYNGLGYLGISNHNFAEARASMLKSIELLERNVEKNTGQYEKELITAYCSLANLYSNAAEISNASLYFIYAENLVNRLMKLYPKVYEPELARVLFETGTFHLSLANDSTGEVKLKSALQILQRLSKEDSVRFQVNLAVVRERLGKFYSYQGKIDSAIALLRDARLVYERIVQTSPEVYESYLAAIYLITSHAEMMKWNLPEASQLLSKAETLYRKFYDKNPEPWKIGLGNTLYQRAMVFQNMQNADSAILLYNAALAQYNAVAEKNAVVSANVVNTYVNLGNIYQALSKLEQGENYLALAKTQQLALAEHSQEMYSPFLAHIQYTLGLLYFRSGDFLRSKKEFEDALDTQQRLASSAKKYEPHLVTMLFESARVYSALNEYRLAEKNLYEALDRQRKLVKENVIYQPYLVTILSTLGNWHRSKGELEISITFLEEAITLQKLLIARDSSYRPYLSELLMGLGNVYAARNDTSKAHRYLLAAYDHQKEIARQDRAQLIYVPMMTESLAYFVLKTNAAEAEKLFREAISMVEVLDSGKGKFQPLLIRLKQGLAWTYGPQKKLDQAVALQKEIIAEQESLAATNPDVEEPNLVPYYGNLALIYRERREFDSAIAIYRRAIDLQEKLAKKNLSFKTLLANLYYNLGRDYGEKGDVKNASSSMRAAISIQKELPQSEAQLLFLQQIYSDYSFLLKTNKDAYGAWQNRFFARSARQKLASINKPMYQHLLIRSRYEDGLSEEERALWESAGLSYQEAIEMFTEHARQNAIDSLLLLDLYAARVRVHRHLPQMNDSDSLLQQAVQLSLKLAASDSAKYEPYVASFYVEIGRKHKYDGDWKPPLQAFRNALQVQERLLVRNSIMYKPFMVSICHELSMLYTRVNLDSADLLMRRALTYQQELVSADSNYRSYLVQLLLDGSVICSLRKEHVRAREALEKALRVQTALEAARSANPNYSVQIFKALGDVFMNVPDYAQAIAMYLKAIERQTGLETNWNLPNSTLAWYYFDLGRAFKMNNERALALEYFYKALTASEKLYAKDPVWLNDLRREIDLLKR